MTITITDEMVEAGAEKLRSCIARLDQVLICMRSARRNDRLMSVWADDVKAIEDAVACLEAALAKAKAEEWRPMSSAPKDGTAIWLFVDGQVCMGYCEPPSAFSKTEIWFAKASFSRSCDKNPDTIFGCYAHGIAPTHWRPLPSPPATEPRE